MIAAHEISCHGSSSGDKSFRPKDQESSGNGTNFHGDKGSNQMHESKTDRSARLYEKSAGKEAKLAPELCIAGIAAASRVPEASQAWVEGGVF